MRDSRLSVRVRYGFNRPLAQLSRATVSLYFCFTKTTQKGVEEMRQFWHRNASTVLTCLGGAGVVLTSVMSVKATPKVIKLLDEVKEEKGEELTKILIRKNNTLYYGNLERRFYYDIQTN